MPLFFRPWSANLLVSVSQTSRQRINYFYVNKTISVSEHRAPTYWFQLTTASFIAYCSHITLFTDLRIGSPLNVGGPWL